MTTVLENKAYIESADAAKALKPIAGEFAFLLFSLGIIGTSYYPFQF